MTNRKLRQRSREAYMKNRIQVVLVLLIAATAAFGQIGIRSVDFKNFTYNAHCIGETPSNITVTNGEFSEEKQEEGYVDRFYFHVFDIAYGDLNADRQDEAIVLSVCNTGGTGNFSEGFVFSMRRGKPVLVGRIAGGDRAYGGLRTTRVERGLLVVESNDVGEMGGACCPEIIVTTKYRLTGGRLVKNGPETRRPIYPTRRVTFDRGMSGKTFTTKLNSGEGKRFVVGARANQSLTVSVDNENVQLRLLEDAQVTEGINNFLAKLPKTGDYTIEVRNDAETAVTVTVNIKIQ